MDELPERVSGGRDLNGGHAAALDALVRFSEASHLIHDPAALIALAEDIHASTFPPRDPPVFLLVAYERDASSWKMTESRGAFPPDSLVTLRAGVPLDVPPLGQMVQERRALFIEWTIDTATRANVPDSAVFHTTAVYPLFRQGEVVSLISFGLTGAQPFTERERLVFLALGHALQLALERAWHAQEREERLLETARRAHALDSFAELSRDLAFESDPGTLIHQALRLLFTLLPGVFAQYWEAPGGEWRAQAQVGPPVWGEGWERLPSPAGGPPARVSAPRRTPQRQSVRVGGEVCGVLEVTPPGDSGWTRADGAVLDTVAYHLGLALDRAEQVRDLQSRQLTLEDEARAARAARAVGEAFSEAVWRDLRHELATPGSGPQGQLVRRLDALLAYAELARRPLRVGLVGLLNLKLDVRGELEGEHPVRWRLEKLSTVRGDRELLRRVLHELLSNAVRAARDRPRPLVEVWSEAHPEGWAVFVRDNGAGFDPGWAELLFEPGGTEGRGMGLAVVKRIVERHGGRVWAEGTPGGGATFAFTLP